MNLYSKKGAVKAIHLWLLKLYGIWYEALFICMMVKHLTPMKLWHALPKFGNRRESEKTSSFNFL